MRKPVDNAVMTSPYGMRVLNGVQQFHDGIDFISRERNSVFAIADGKITFSMKDYDDSKRWTDIKDSAGNYIIVEHDIDGKIYYCRYLHLKFNDVQVGQIVNEGDILGDYADVGISYGAHIHFDCYTDKWIKIDPTFIFNGLS